MKIQNKNLPVAVIGAGPVGLAAAAHLLEHGERPVVFEAGASVAHAVRQWSHVKMFSPWRYNIDSAARRLLEQSDWRQPDCDHLPTGGELVSDYLEPLSKVPSLAECLRFESKVLAVTREGIDKVRTQGRAERAFLLRVDEKGEQSESLFKAVIDASGTWGNPNPMGSHGLHPIGEESVRDRIEYGLPDILGKDQADYRNATVLVVGSGHSAFTGVLELLELKKQYPETSIIWVMRKRSLDKVFGGGANDALPARGELGSRAKAAVDAGEVELISPLEIQRVVREGESQMKVVGYGPDGEREFVVDRAIVKTGFRPDLGILREVRIAIDESLESVHALGPLIDPNEHSCGSVPPHGARELAHPEQDFYIVGMKSYGRAPTFLLATGYEQVRSVAAEIAGDHEAAARVELNLPETGVCSAGPAPSCNGVSASSCGVEEKEKSEAACCGQPDQAASDQERTSCCG
ncbi:NAD(P)-binding domain-containing protein [Roseibacillus persicicus]|uniref:NAD(P)-binding domain-containing protein n=1 Tax=Roseibacillus persicicus TaxID=454148 RepID=UPI0016761D38|nr:NAD(P)-binding domain-containing protein [Roseibacillus persicicus]